GAVGCGRWRGRLDARRAVLVTIGAGRPVTAACGGGLLCRGAPGGGAGSPPPRNLPRGSVFPVHGALGEPDTFSNLWGGPRESSAARAPNVARDRDSRPAEGNKMETSRIRAQRSLTLMRAFRAVYPGIP